MCDACIEETEQNTTEDVSVLEPREQNPALAAVYKDLPPDVVAICEQARMSIRAAYVSGLVAVHKAMASSGKFKAWCAAVGLNYHTALCIVRRATAKQSSGQATHGRSSADGGAGDPDPDPDPDPKPAPKPRKPKPSAGHGNPPKKKESLVFVYPPDECERICAWLEAACVLYAVGSHEEALLRCAEEWWRRHPEVERPKEVSDDDAA